jgi:hypothetical protein
MAKTAGEVLEDSTLIVIQAALRTNMAELGCLSTT